MVCILAAGQGTRISAFGGRLHKALLPLGEMPVLTRIIGAFPATSEFVVALGHESEQVRGYLALAHPEVSIRFIDIDPYAGPGSGPGRSLLACREAVDGPFVLTACDAICTLPIPRPDFNWMGVQYVDDPAGWCTLTVDDGRVSALHYRDPDGPHQAFVGVAGIHDASLFFEGLERSLSESGEIQVNGGFEALLDRGITTVEVGWLDTGMDDTYGEARKALGIEHDLTIAGKQNDVTYRVSDRVVKVFFEAGKAGRLCRRLASVQGAGPLLLGSNEVGIAYEYVEGVPLDHVVEPGLVRDFLNWCEASLWSADVDAAGFAASCRAVYVDKSQERLDAFCRQQGWVEEPDCLRINGLETSCIGQHLADLVTDRAFTLSGQPSSIHGDLHGANVIVGDDGFRLIDWREQFGSSAEVGDVYYDLGKFVHTLELSVQVMERHDYTTRLDGTEAEVRHPADEGLSACREAFWDWLGGRFDARRTAVADALVFVGMAPLYEPPLSTHLYLLGRLLLHGARSGDVPARRLYDVLVGGNREG
jgi:dTDP-glucose pyrophosphorylase